MNAFPARCASDLFVGGLLRLRIGMLPEWMRPVSWEEEPYPDDTIPDCIRIEFEEETASLQFAERNTPHGTRLSEVAIEFDSPRDRPEFSLFMESVRGKELFAVTVPNDGGQQRLLFPLRIERVFNSGKSFNPSSSNAFRLAGHGQVKSYLLDDQVIQSGNFDPADFNEEFDLVTTTVI